MVVCVYVRILNWAVVSYSKEYSKIFSYSQRDQASIAQCRPEILLSCNLVNDEESTTPKSSVMLPEIFSNAHLMYSVAQLAAVCCVKPAKMYVLASIHNEELMKDNKNIIGYNEFDLVA